MFVFFGMHDISGHGNNKESRDFLCSLKIKSVKEISSAIETRNEAAQGLICIQFESLNYSHIPRAIFAILW